jgi:hypothetical protein
MIRIDAGLADEIVARLPHPDQIELRLGDAARQRIARAGWIIRRAGARRDRPRQRGDLGVRHRISRDRDVQSMAVRIPGRTRAAGRAPGTAQVASGPRRIVVGVC